MIVSEGYEYHCKRTPTGPGIGRCKVKDTRPLRCRWLRRHVWREEKRSHVTYNIKWVNLGNESHTQEKYSLILWTCERCGEHRTTREQGHW